MIKVIVRQTAPDFYEIFNAAGISLHLFREERAGYVKDNVRQWLSSFDDHIEVEWQI